MKFFPLVSANVLFALAVLPAAAQSTTRFAKDTSPVYEVTVISRTTPAVNYGHRNLPTKIDFRGTVLYPEARGEATVESRRGAADIDAKFSNLDSPARFGPTYLTYVLWALTPQGRPVNLGELVLNSANKGRLKVSSELQSFAMIVTAEPYYSVTQPSGVVVMENIVRPDTVGNIETVEAKYELLPRQHFTYETGSRDRVQDTPKVTMNEYESLLALYQAQNALQIAKSAGADQAAPDIMQRAEQLYQQAQTYHSQKSAHKQVVMTARQAAQTAEDARILALKRQAPQQSSLTQ